VYGSLGPQPISSLSTIFVLPPMPATSPLKTFENQPLLAYGTAGTDAVSGMEPVPVSGGTCTGSWTDCINGAVHVVPLLPAYHYTASDMVTGPSTLLADIEHRGVTKLEPPGYPQPLENGERVYGSIVAAGDQLFFNTSVGTVSDIDQRGTLGGSSYRLLLSAASNPLYNYITALGLKNDVGGAGGTPMLDVATGQLVVVTDKSILKFNAPPGGTTNGASVNGRGATPTGLLSWFFRRRGLEY
jgi:hypothetical protein